MRFNRCVLLLFFLAPFSFLKAQSDSLVQPKRIKILPVPAFGYSPETRTYAGFVALATINLYPDSNQRVSNAKLEFNYSANKQFIVEGGWNYFFKQEKWFSTGLVHVSKYPDRYYGMDAKIRTREVLFESNRIRIEANLLKSIKSAWFIGPSLRFLQYSNVVNNGIYDYKELVNRRIKGLGLTVVRDKRNNILNAEHGHYLNFGAQFNQSASSKIWSYNQNDYWKFVFDLRKYFMIKDKVTLAFRSYSQFNSDNPVYFDRAVGGGDQFVRGFFFGRFRNKHLTTLQGEVRVPVYGRFGLSTFGGLSQMYGNNFSGDPLDLLNFGGGLRIMMDKAERINLRLDYAIGLTTGNEYYEGFYVAFGESF